MSRPTIRRARLAVTGALLLASSAAVSGELRVHAPVVNVEPVKGPDRTVEECEERPNAQDAGIGRTLAWDLGVTCTTHRVPSTEITGYRVYYEWDNRIYNQVMADYPGATVPLRVTVD